MSKCLCYILSLLYLYVTKKWKYIKIQIHFKQIRMQCTNILKKTYNNISLYVTFTLPHLLYIIIIPITYTYDKHTYKKKGGNSSTVRILVFKIKDAGSIPASLVKIIIEKFLKNLFFKRKRFNFLYNSLKRKNKYLDWNNTLKIKFKNYKYIFFTKNFFYKKGNYLNIFFLRKTKYFNKGRYSRNRQIYRTGVYLCFYINIIILYFLWFFFYKFSIKFTYLWWLFYLFISSFVFSKSIKYNFFYPKEFIHFINNYVSWVMIILRIKK